MRVIAEQAFETYFEMRLLRIPEGLEFKGSLAAHALACGAPVRVIDPDRPQLSETPRPQPVADELDITWTAEKVLAWVGDDPGRAAAAWDVESGKDKPRKTLLTRLEEIAD